MKVLPFIIGLLIAVMPQISIAGDTPVEPYPLEYWGLRAVTNQVELSPDGKRIGMMKNLSREGNPIIEIYETDDMDKEPFRINAEPMELTGYSWVNNETIVFSARQQVRDRIEGFNQGVYENRFAFANIKNKKIRVIKEPNPALASVLPFDEDKVILSFQEGPADGPGQKIAEAFRPRSYWKYDVNTGSRQLVIRGKLSLGNIGFDEYGTPITASGFDLPKGELVLYYRPEGTNRWEEVRRIDEHDFNGLPFVVYGDDESKPGNLYARAKNGRDTIGLWSVNLERNSFDELIYGRNDVDVTGVRFHSNSWKYPGKVVGVSYGKEKIFTEYFDEIEGATYAQLEQVIPHSYNLSINSRSEDGSKMTIYNFGPKDPGTYYLLNDGKLTLVGTRQPLLESEKLAETQYVVWEARDGATIPGYVTIPHGKPPFPLVVLPHGGPFVQEVVQYDEWSQLLANNGYLVLQPQYRGSRGYGDKFYLSAFMNEGGGQGGYKMQDDKDDGAMYLVEQGLADPERMAMFGWSYGGYAALVAASRTPQIYQCVIAGAAVTDTNMQVNYYRYALRGTGQLEQLRMWDDSIAPIDEVPNVNVPILMIHGDVDQRVPPEHARRYVKELDKHNKNYKFMWLEGADHFSSTLFYDHKLKLYTAMIDYLRNDCGPGGLQAMN